MRVALLSDIHGNRWALEAVLADAAARRVDALWNLGDILSGPLDPAGTAARLLPLGLVTIAGNHERGLLACEARPGSASDAFAFARLDREQLAWVRGLPASARPAPDVLLCHGTPASDLEPLLDTWARRQPMRAATAAEVEERLAGVGQGVRLVACGHTHMPRLLRLASGALVVNPGSVGLQAFDYTDDEGERHVAENGTPWASYAIVEASGAAPARRFEGELRRVEYDHHAAAAQAERGGRPDWAHALRTGLAAPAP